MFEIPTKHMKEQATAQPPAWLADQNDTIRHLFSIVLEQALAIRNKIEDGEDLGARSRRLSLRKLSESVGKNTTYLNGRDYPEFTAFVESTNSDLESEYIKRRGSIKRPKSNEFSIETMSRAELLELTKLQRDELNQLRETSYTQQLIHMIDAGLLDTHNRNAARIDEYLRTIRTLQEDLSIARSRMQETDNSMIDLMGENQDLKRLLSEARVKTKPTLKSV